MRRSLANEAIEELALIKRNLKSQIELTMELGPRTHGDKISVGNGVLKISDGEILPFYEPLVWFQSIPNIRGPYKRSGWDVLAFASMEIQQRNYDRRGPRGAQYCWVSTLVFAQHPDHSDYRWWEMAFYSLEDAPEHFTTCIVEPEDRSFDIVLAGHLHVKQLAFGPVLCDGENELAARNRWLALFAEASIAKIRLNPPPIPVPDSYFANLENSETSN